MYGCAVWGYGAINEIEAYHLQFVKRTLGVKVTTNSCVVYAETGRFLLHIDINLCMIKYWIKILNSDVKKLIHVAYNTMLQHPEKYAWIKHIKTYYAAMALRKHLLTFLNREVKMNSIRNASTIYKQRQMQTI